MVSYSQGYTTQHKHIAWFGPHWDRVPLRSVVDQPEHTPLCYWWGTIVFLLWYKLLFAYWSSVLVRDWCPTQCQTLPKGADSLPIISMRLGLEEDWEDPEGIHTPVWQKPIDPGYTIGEWILMMILHEETGKWRKLSRQYGWYEIVDCSDPDLMNMKVGVLSIRQCS